MAWWHWLSPEQWPMYLAILAMLGLAAFLLGTRHAHPAGMLLALFLVAKALQNITAFLSNTASFTMLDAEAALFWGGLTPYFAIAVPTVLVYFMFLYPRPALRRVHPWPMVAISVVGLVLLAWYLVAPGSWLSHELWGPNEEYPTGAFWVAPAGPFAALLAATFLIQGIAALTFGWEALARRPGPVRQNLVVMSAAFAMTALFDSLQVLGATALGAFPVSAYGINQWGALLGGIPIAILAIRFAVVRDATMAPMAKRYALGLLLAFVLGALKVAEYAGWLPNEMAFFSLGMIRISLPVLTAFALFRYGMFDLDVRVKAGLPAGLLAAMLAGIFIVGNEWLEQQLAGDSLVSSIAMAIVLAVATRPIYRIARRGVDRLMPSEDDRAEEERKAALYRGVLQEAVEDGVVSARERRILDSLRRTLQLSDDAALALERQVGLA